MPQINTVLRQPADQDKGTVRVMAHEGKDIHASFIRATLHSTS